MENSFLKQAADFLKNKKSARRWLVLFVCLAVAVTTGTFAALKLNGQAMTKKSLACSFEVHKHTDDCYETAANGEKTLVCGYADYAVHTHTAECFDENGELVCQLPEVEEHKHTESCFETQKVLTCTEEESNGHTHDDSCYQVEQILNCGKEESAGHTHSDVCYDTEGNLVCGMEESESHTHSAECYQEERTLVCGKEESAGHIHSDACYTEEKVATCGKLELHTHDEKCYATPEDAKDNDGDGKADGRPICGIPELVKHEHDESCFVDVQGAADEQKLSFFTTTAEDPEVAGDSVENDSDESAAPTTDEPTNDGANEPTGEGTGETTQATLQKVYEDANIKVTVSYDENAGIPEEAVLRAEQITPESDSAHFAEREAQMQERLGDDTVDMKMLLKIGFYVDGGEIEPKSPVQITIQLMQDGFAAGDPITVIHFGDSATEAIQGTDVTTDGEGNLTTSFQTNSFSEFGISNIDLPVPAAETLSSDLRDYIASQKLTTRDGKDLEKDENGNYKVEVGSNYVYSVEFDPKKAGETSFHNPMYFDLGPNAKCTPADNLPLMQGNKKVGSYSITEDGKVEVWFDETYLTQADQKLNMEFSMAVTSTKQGAGETYPWQGNATGSYVIVDEAGLNVDKTAGYYSASKNQLTYTVEATVTHGMLVDGKIQDVFGTTGVNYSDGSATIKILDEDGKDITAEYSDLPELKATNDGWTLEPLPNLTEGQKVVIEYKVDLPDGIKNGTVDQVTNTVTFDGKTEKGDPVEPAKDTETKNFADDLLDKSGELLEGGKIKWHVKIGDGRSDPTKNGDLTITDELSSGLAFTGDGLLVTVYDEDGNEKANYIIPWSEIDTTKKDNGKITYTLKHGMPKNYTWEQGDYFEVTYQTTYDESKMPPEGFQNTVSTEINGHKVTDTEKLPIGDGVEKTVEDDEKGQCLKYTIEMNVPSANNMTKMGDSGDDHTGLHYFYIRDRLYSKETNDFVVEGKSLHYYAKNVPENIKIVASGTDSAGVPHETVFKNYPYSGLKGLGDEGANTYQIVRGSEDKSKNPGENASEFLIYFNTARYGTEPDGILDHHDSIWDIEYPTKLTITYEVPYDTQLVDENGRLVYRRNADGTLSEEPMTVGGFLAAGGTMRNKTNEVRRGVDKSDEVTTQKLPKTGEITKNNRLLEDGVVEYRVMFENYDPNNADARYRLIKADGSNNTVKYDTVVFEDEFDSRLEYVPGSLRVEVYRCGKEPGDEESSTSGLGQMLAAFIYDSSTGPVSSDQANKITAKFTDFGTKTYTATEKDGTLRTGEKTIKDCFDNKRTFVFVYQLRLKEEYRNGENNMDLQNTAHLKYGGKDLTDDSFVDIPAKHLNKDVVVDKDAGTATYTIEVNPVPINLVKDIKDDAGNVYDPKNYEMVDTMSDNQILMDLQGEPNPHVQYWNGENWADMIRTTDPNQVEPESTGEEWIPYYYQTEHPDGENGMSLTLPDETKIRVVYTVQIKGNTGANVPIYNEAKLTADVEIADIEDTDFEIGDNHASVTGTPQTKVMKYKTDTMVQVPGAKFALYTEKGPAASGCPDNIKDTITVWKNDKKVILYYRGSYTTGEFGEIEGLTANDGEKGDGLYAMVEFEAPEGYVLNTEPTFFQFEPTDTGVEQVDTVTMDEGFAGLNKEEYKVQHPGSGAVVIYNDYEAYELPKTGGIGNVKPYTVGALFALAAVGILLYTTQKRRKEGN